MAEKLSELSTPTNVTLDRLLAESFEELRTAIGEKAKDRTGGFARLYVSTGSETDLRQWREVYKSRIGRRKDDIFYTTENFSVEKVIRLMKKHAFRGHVSSEQSRNPGEREFGGAFIVNANVPELGGEVFLMPSFSGLPDEFKADETVWMLALRKVGWCQLQDFSAVMAESENSLAVQLLKGLEV